MSLIRRTLLAGAAAGLLAFGLLAVPALAATSVAAMTAPPTPLIAPMPVEACVGDECEDTPDLTSVSLVVTATLTRSGLTPPPPPLILPIACPGEASDGTALIVVATDSGKLGVAVNLVGVGANGLPYLETLEPASVRSKAGAAILVTACTQDDEGDDEDRDH